MERLLPINLPTDLFASLSSKVLRGYWHRASADEPWSKARPSSRTTGALKDSAGSSKASSAFPSQRSDALCIGLGFISPPVIRATAAGQNSRDQNSPSAVARLSNHCTSRILENIARDDVSRQSITNPTTNSGCLPTRSVTSHKQQPSERGQWNVRNESDDHSMPNSIGHGVEFFEAGNVSNAIQSHNSVGPETLRIFLLGGP